MPAGDPVPETPSDTTLGILAGGSRLPLELADAVTGRGRPVHIVGIEGHAEPEITRFPHTWVNWGGIGAMVRAFRDNRCRQLVIVGRVSRPNLTALRPDLGFIASLPALLPLLRGGDDAILRHVIRFFERQGLEVVGAHEAAPELLAPAGVIGAKRPAPPELAAITLAARTLAAVGPFDAAQAAAATDLTLLAIEGADGTDAMLRRLAANRPRHGRERSGVLVKLPKPGQERRIDLPTIGPDTVHRALEAGLAGIAVESGETLIAERAEVVRLADDAGMFLLGLEHGASTPANAADTADHRDIHHDLPSLDALRQIGSRRPSQTARSDAALGASLIGALEPFWPRASVIVSRGYVLASEGPGGATAAVERSGRLKPWGARLLRRAVGVLVMTDVTGELGPDPRLIATRARASGLAGITILRSPLDATALAVLATACDEAGLFLLAPGNAL